MLKEMFEATWFDKILFPVVLAIITNWLLKYVPRLFSRFRSGIGRRRARKLLKKASAFIGAQSMGSTDTVLLITMSHLIVRATFLIVAVTGTLVFYSLSVLRPEVSIGPPVFVMAIFSGLMLNLVNNVWDELSENALASMGPEKFIDDLEVKLGETYRNEFKVEIAGLRTVANQIWQQRKAMITISAVVDALGDREAANPTVTPAAQTPVPEETATA